MIECPTLSHQGVKNKDQFPPEVVEAYKYTFSKPGALTAPLNYYRALFNTRCSLSSTTRKTIDVPTLIIWVSVRVSE